MIKTVRQAKDASKKPSGGAMPKTQSVDSTSLNLSPTLSISPTKTNSYRQQMDGSGSLSKRGTVGSSLTRTKNSYRKEKD